MISIEKREKELKNLLRTYNENPGANIDECLVRTQIFDLQNFSEELKKYPNSKEKIEIDVIAQKIIDTLILLVKRKF